MKKEQKCISLSLAKELKEIADINNFRLPESEYVWVKSKDKDYFGLIEYPIKKLVREAYSAFDTSELGEILPIIFKTDTDLKQYLDCYQIENKEWECSYGEALEGIYFTEITEAEARGKMLVYLIKNNLIK